MIPEINEPMCTLSEKQKKELSEPVNVPINPDSAPETDPLNYLHEIALNSNKFLEEKEGNETVNLPTESKSSFFFIFLKRFREKLKFSKVQKLSILGVLCGWVVVIHWWGQTTQQSSSSESLLGLQKTSKEQTLKINKKFSEQIQQKKKEPPKKTETTPKLESTPKIVEPVVLPVAKTEASPIEYKVLKGDSLYKIALEKMGGTQYVEELARYNQLESSYKIRVGQTLKIPPGFPKTPQVAANLPLILPTETTLTGEEYRVMEGDSLYKIAERKLGSKQYAREIAEYNQLKDPSLIRVGQVLKIPEKTTLKKN